MRDNEFTKILGWPGCRVLKRGKQPDLPPCPDPPLAASAPVDSRRTRSLSPSEALIERAREAAFEFSENLPNFICQEVMARYRQRGREETSLDVVSAEIIYDHGKESYRNLKINDRPTDTSLEEISGSWSTGEFASTLLSLFSADTNARFRPGGASSISVSAPRFTTLKCQGKIRAGRCTLALRLWFRLTKARYG